MAYLAKTIQKFFDLIENSRVFRAVRKGLVTAIPILMIGSVALILLSLPIETYQEFLTSPDGEILHRILTIIHGAAFNFLAPIFLITISYSYAELYSNRLSMRISVPLVAFCCFVIMSGVESETFSMSNFGVNGLFLAILTAIFSSMLFIRLASIKKLNFRIYADGTDHDFNTMFSLILPGAIVLLVFGIAHYVLFDVLGVKNLSDLLAEAMINVFTGLGKGILTGVLFVFFLNVFWFFGIHGGNVMDNVSQQYFAEGTQINAANIAAGLAPTEILNKTFFDVFVFMGGCGTILSLVIAIFLFSRRRSMRDIAKMGVAPVLFNVNEFVMFGLPVVFNPVLLIPFVLTPVAATVISYFATYLGLVPYAAQTVGWTTPVFFSGYMATGSAAGCILQAVNLAVGVFLYRPFIRLYERKQVVNLKKDIEELAAILAEAENKNEPPELLGRNDRFGSVAKMLATDLRHAVRQKTLELYYQPQVRIGGDCFGAEALLRWKHEIGGFITPPLVIQIAREAGFLPELEEYILDMGSSGIAGLNREIGSEFQISLNITADFLKIENFVEKVQGVVRRNGANPRNICIEVTEQTVLEDTPDMARKLSLLRQEGYQLSIDDFGMGHTSLRYLKNSQFDQVKLDGELVKDMMRNERSAEIIASIIYLSKSLHFSVLAEYVETIEEVDRLTALGCNEFQGYLFSAPLAYDEFVKKALWLKTQAGGG